MSPGPITALIRPLALCTTLALLSACGVGQTFTQPPEYPEPTLTGFATLPLSSPIRTRDLRDFQTVEGLGRYLALRFGYELKLEGSGIPFQARWISQWPPNPAIFAQEIRPASEVLSAAIYPRGQLVIDPTNRIISFQMAPDTTFSPANPFWYPVTGEFTEQ